MKIKVNLSNKSIGENEKLESYPIAETEILILSLMSSKKIALSRDELFQYAWSDKVVTDNSLNVAIKNIRDIFKKIGYENAIQTIRGYGYCLSTDIEITYKVKDRILLSREASIKLSKNNILEFERSIPSENTTTLKNKKPLLTTKNLAHIINNNIYLTTYILISIIVITAIQTLL